MYNDAVPGVVVVLCPISDAIIAITTEQNCG
jgi:hypothetical protein